MEAINFVSLLNYYDRLTSANNIVKNKQYEIWGNNIEVVLSFYYDLFINYFDAAQQEWLINELKAINDKNMLENNQIKRKTKRNIITLIAQDSNLITMELIKEKLADIHFYRYGIAEMV